MSDRESKAIKRFADDLKKMLYFHSYPITTNMDSPYTYDELENLIDYLVQDFNATYVEE